MKKISSKAVSVTALAVNSAMAATQVSASGQNGEGSSVSSRANERTIVGVWRTVVTVLNCQTGEPVAPLFKVCSLLTMVAPWRNMVSVPVRVRLCVVPGTDFGSVNTAGKILDRFHLLPL